MLACHVFDTYGQVGAHATPNKNEIFTQLACATMSPQDFRTSRPFRISGSICSMDVGNESTSCDSLKHDTPFVARLDTLHVSRNNQKQISLDSVLCKRART